MSSEIEKSLERVQALKNRIASLRDGYTAKQDAIRNNKDLTEQGKQKSLAQLKAEKRIEIDKLVSDLRKETAAQAIEIDKLQRMRDTLVRDYSEWDYSRLNYEAQAVKSALAIAGGDYYAIDEAWQRVKAGGDRYAIRAWMDTAPAMLPPATNTSAANSDETRGEIMKDIASADFMTLTGDAAKFEAERKERLAHLHDLAKAAREVGTELLDGRTDRKTYVAEFVFDGISLDGESGQLMVERETGEDAKAFIERTQAEYNDQSKKLADYVGTGYDPLLYGVK